MKCKYCGKSAGLLKTKHKECDTNDKAASEIITKY